MTAWLINNGQRVENEGQVLSLPNSLFCTIRKKGPSRWGWQNRRDVGVLTAAITLPKIHMYAFTWKHIFSLQSRHRPSRVRACIASHCNLFKAGTLSTLYPWQVNCEVGVLEGRSVPRREALKNLGWYVRKSEWGAVEVEIIKAKSTDFLKKMGIQFSVLLQHPWTVVGHSQSCHWQFEHLRMQTNAFSDPSCKNDALPIHGKNKWHAVHHMSQRH